MFYNFITDSIGFFNKPIRTLSNIYENYKEDILKYGLIISIISNISMLLGRKIMNLGAAANGTGYLISYLFYSIFIIYFIVFISLAIYYLAIGFMKKEVNINEMSGLYLATDFPNFIILPLSIILRALPWDLSILFNLISVFILILSIILKIKSLTITSKINSARSLGLILIPYALIIFLVSFNIVYFIIFIVNALK